jgi:F0F1-type ATP synthase membrane subunit b/b'
MDLKRNIKELREKAAKYRAAARQTIDPNTAQVIFELTAELEQQVRNMEQGK